jgi:NAD(P)-dependent dehydrogenase (short-subunit alcohol dehydrogenase family)
MDINLKGKVALVTGAGSGIGRASAIAMAKSGASVVVSDLSAEHGKQTLEQIRKENGSAEFFLCDVSKSEDVKKLVAFTVEKFGGLDIAHNNAGIGIPPAMLADIPDDQFDKITAINFKSVFLGMKYEIPEMLKRGGGSIINTASALGHTALQASSAYVACKHGVVGMTKAAALDYAEQNIRVNALCPGVIDTPIIPEESKESLKAIHPVNRLGVVDELVGAILYLASDLSTFTTGSSMIIDGGWNAR